MAIWLGNEIGSLDEVDYGGDDFCWGESLRVRVAIDIQKASFRGVKINSNQGQIGRYVASYSI